MNQRFRRPDELTAIVVEHPVSIDPFEIAQPRSLTGYIKRFLNPSYIASLALHLVLLVCMAWWILPAISDRTTELVVAAVPTDELEAVDLNGIEIAFDENDSPEQDDLTDVNFGKIEAAIGPDDSQVMYEFAGAGPKDELEGFLEADLVELADGPVADGAVAAGDPAMVAAAKAIQEKVVKAGGKIGEVQFSLAWKTKTDLDIHVVTPNGERIFYDNPRSACLGLLDVDANRDDDRDLTEEPVENIRWLKGKPESGRYTIIVHYYRTRGRTKNIEYEMMAKTGESIDVVKKQIDFRNRLHVFRYVYFDESFSAEKRERVTSKLKEVQKREEQLAQQRLSNIRPGRGEQTALWSLSVDFPHTDAAIEALKRMTGAGK